MLVVPAISGVGVLAVSYTHDDVDVEVVVEVDHVLTG